MRDGDLDIRTRLAGRCSHATSAYFRVLKPETLAFPGNKRSPCIPGAYAARRRYPRCDGELRGDVLEPFAQAKAAKTAPV